jgi:hypothetical protein
MNNCDCGPVCDLSCSTSPRLFVFGEWLFLRAADADLAHAQQQNGTGGAGTVPFGTIGTLELEHSSGFRLGGGIACGACSGVEFSYTFFESDSFNSVDPPFIPGGGGAVGSLVHHPAASITASVGPLDAVYEIDYQLADIVYSNQLLSGNRYVVNYLLGAQFAHLDQDFAQAGFFSGGAQGAIDTITAIDFDGAGLKAGLDSEHCLRGGLSVYGRATAAVLVGEFRSEYVMVNRTADVLLAQAIWQDNRTVTQFEYELGLAWLSANQRCRFATGYMVSVWNDAVTTPEFIDAVRKDNYTNVDGELSFSGLVSRVEMRW